MDTGVFEVWAMLEMAFPNKHDLTALKAVLKARIYLPKSIVHLHRCFAAKY